jgi:hypothetical protein
MPPINGRLSPQHFPWWGYFWCGKSNLVLKSELGLTLLLVGQHGQSIFLPENLIMLLQEKDKCTLNKVIKP